MVLDILASAYQRTILFLMYILLLSLFIALGFVKWRKAAVLFAGVQRKTWLWLLAVFLAGAVLRFSVFPTYHMMYVDESLYMGMASNLNHRLEPVLCVLGDNGRDEMCWLQYQKPPGWPFLISLGFLAFGEDEQVGFFLSALFGSLSILLIFFLCFLLFRRERAGLWAAALLAFFPLHIIWSHSAETNIPSVFFILFTLTALFFYQRVKDAAFLFLTSILFLLSVSMRYENVLLAFLFLIAFCPDWTASVSPGRRTWLLALITAILLALTAMLTMISSNFFRHIPLRFTLDFYLLNIFSYTKLVSMHFALLLLAVLLLFSRVRSRNTYGATYIVVSSFLILSVMSIPLLKESRTVLLPGIFLLMLAATSVSRLSELLSYRAPATLALNWLIPVVLLIILYVSYTPLTDTENPSYLETISSKQVRDAISGDCMVVAEQPVVLQPTSLQLLPTRFALLHPDILDAAIEEGKCLYYFYDRFCFGDGIGRSPNQCRHFLTKYATIADMKFPAQDKEYVLYRVTGIAS